MILDSSCLYGSSTRLGLTVVSISEGDKERIESRGLDMHLDWNFLWIRESRKNKLLTDTL